MTIISSDKDLMQLVGPKVTLYDTMKDKRLGIADVIEKWGVPPEKMIDLQSLTGDSVDNVPGVPGIGPKTAATLLEEYGDLETLLARAGEIKQEKRREGILANIDKIRLSRELVTLKNDVPDVLPLDAMAMEPVNGPKLVAFLKAMEFTSLTRRVAEATGTDASAIDPAHVVVDGDRHGPDVDEGSTLPHRVCCANRPLPVGERGRRRPLRLSLLPIGEKTVLRSKTVEGPSTPQALAKSRAESAVAASN